MIRLEKPKLRLKPRHIGFPVFAVGGLKKFENQEVPRPDFWGGFQIEVNYWEFWQGRRNRTHDRFCYTQNTQGWNIERMSP